MPKKKPTTKKSVATTKGSGHLKSTNNKWLNWKYVVPLVALVALAGGFLVSKSSASSTWVTHAQKSYGIYTLSTNNWTLRTGSIGPYMSPPYTYRYCAWVRAPKGSHAFAFGGGWSPLLTTVNVPQSTSFTKRCGPAGSMKKESISQEASMQLTVDVNGNPLRTIEVQQVSIERQ